LLPILLQSSAAAPNERLTERCSLRFAIIRSGVAGLNLQETQAGTSVAMLPSRFFFIRGGVKMKNFARRGAAAVPL
jgi:hypothetical protein